MTPLMVEPEEQFVGGTQRDALVSAIEDAQER